MDPMHMFMNPQGTSSRGPETASLLQRIIQRLRSFLSGGTYTNLAEFQRDLSEAYRIPDPVERTRRVNDVYRKAKPLLLDPRTAARARFIASQVSAGNAALLQTLQEQPTYTYSNVASFRQELEAAYRLTDPAARQRRVAEVLQRAQPLFANPKTEKSAREVAEQAARTGQQSAQTRQQLRAKAREIANRAIQEEIARIQAEQKRAKAREIANRVIRDEIARIQAEQKWERDREIADRVIREEIAKLRAGNKQKLPALEQERFAGVAGRLAMLSSTFVNLSPEEREQAINKIKERIQETEKAYALTPFQKQQLVSILRGAENAHRGLLYSEQQRQAKEKKTQETNNAPTDAATANKQQQQQPPTQAQEKKMTMRASQPPQPASVVAETQQQRRQPTPAPPASSVREQVQRVLKQTRPVVAMPPSTRRKQKRPLAPEAKSAPTPTVANFPNMRHAALPGVGLVGAGGRTLELKDDTLKQQQRIQRWLGMDVDTAIAQLRGNIAKRAPLKERDREKKSSAAQVEAYLRSLPKHRKKAEMQRLTELALQANREKQAAAEHTYSVFSKSLHSGAPLGDLVYAAVEVLGEEKGMKKAASLIKTLKERDPYLFLRAKKDELYSDGFAKAGALDTEHPFVRALEGERQAEALEKETSAFLAVGRIQCTTARV